jgi:hypothetical protein
MHSGNGELHKEEQPSARQGEPVRQR